MDTMALVLVIGVVGSVASIIGLLIAASGLKSKFIHMGYGLFITVLAAGIVDFQHRVSATQRQLEELQRVESEARKLLTTMVGFMLASLSFLEKFKDRLPDTYARAVKLCENSGCLESGYGKDANSYTHFLSMQEASGAMEYLLKGLAAGGARVKEDGKE